MARSLEADRNGRHPQAVLRRFLTTRVGASALTLGLAAGVLAAAAVAAVVSYRSISGGSELPLANLPPAKGALLQEEEARRAAARAAARPKPPIPLAVAPKPIPPRVSELLRGFGQSPFSPTEFRSNST